MDDDFQIITAPYFEEDINKLENNINQNKSILNKVCKKNDLISKPKCSLKPAWNDDMDETKIGKVYDCLDIMKIQENNDNKTKKAKMFSVCGKEKILTPGFLDYFRCADGNRDYPNKKYISFAICHKIKKCMIVGSNEGTIGIFKVDGENNDAMCKPLYFENFPIKGGVLLSNKNKLVFFSKHNYFKVLNLSTSVVTQYSIERPNIIHRMEASPSGEYLVVSTKTSTVYVISSKTFVVIYKVNVSGTIKSLAFSHEGKYLYVFEDEGTISIFEYKQGGTLLFVRRWFDEGGNEAVRLAVSPDDRYVVCAGPGYVNIYLLNDIWKTQRPKPIKTFTYQDTRINQLAFNQSSEILAIGYCQTGDKNSGTYRIVHLASMTVFSNFPEATNQRTRPTSFSFSPGGKYLAVGQFNGKVALFNLKYFDKY